MINYGFTKELDAPFERVRESAIEELKKEGFGILTEIDVRAKFKEKLGIEFRKYVILGACNPPNAHKAILAEENVGLMLPCNVIVYEKGGKNGDLGDQAHGRDAGDREPGARTHREVYRRETEEGLRRGEMKKARQRITRAVSRIRDVHAAEMNQITTVSQGVYSQWRDN